MRDLIMMWQKKLLFFYIMSHPNAHFCVEFLFLYIVLENMENVQCLSLYIFFFFFYLCFNAFHHHMFCLRHRLYAPSHKKTHILKKIHI